MNKNPERLIVDHYAFDERWEKYLRPYVSRICVIDDLADHVGGF
jgi:UDP-2,4-diacetamido-2,4,6-trideoxy-beta-L-altropyranose hydrolase